MSFDWTAWCMMSPQPAKVLVHYGLGKTPDTISPTNGAGRWRAVAGRIASAVAGGDVDHLEAVDKGGNLIRSCDSEGNDHGEDDDKETDDSGGAFLKHMKAWDRRAAEKAYADAAILDRHGNYMMHAFREGVNASSSQQDHLVSLVETLTAHLSQTIASLHAVSINYANAVARDHDEGATQVNQNSEMLSKVLGEAASRMMMGAAANGAAPGKKPSP
jgi:hypothetical protein